MTRPATETKQTAVPTELLIAVLVFIIVVLVTVLVIRSRANKARKNEQTQQPAAPRDPFAADQNSGGDPETIKAGDLLEFGNEKFFVRGTLRISEGGYDSTSWTSCGAVMSRARSRRSSPAARTRGGPRTAG